MIASGRRNFVRTLSGLLLAGAATRSTARERTIRIGLTPVFLDDQAGFLQEWQRYLGDHLGLPVLFVQRGSYREIVELLLKDEIDFAWLCGYPFVRHRERIRLLAVPVYRGRPFYQSYLIVPAGDRATASLLDLRDRVFAYSDPDSNSGFLHTQYRLLGAGVKPATFFRRSFFTYGHRNVVDAVASGVAHGGAVDGYVWETLREVRPALVDKTRVVERSPDFGFPPLVAAPAVSTLRFREVQAVLLEMHRSPDGKGLLDRLRLDRFDAGAPPLYDGIARMARALRDGRI